MTNPYLPKTQEHRLWAQWNEPFFLQPTSTQLYEVEGHLQHLKHRFRTLIVELESEIDLLEQMAEHAHIAIVTHQDEATD